MLFYFSLSPAITSGVFTVGTCPIHSTKSDKAKKVWWDWENYWSKGEMLFNVDSLKTYRPYCCSHSGAFQPTLPFFLSPFMNLIRSCTAVHTRSCTIARHCFARRRRTWLTKDSENLFNHNSRFRFLWRRGHSGKKYVLWCKKITC
jgi:hypothetical protein